MLTINKAALFTITVILRFAVITDPAPGTLLARTPAGQGILDFLGRLASGVTLWCRSTTAPS